MSAVETLEATEIERDGIPSSVVVSEHLYEVVDGRRVEHSPMGAYEGLLANLLKEICDEFPNRRKLGRCVVEILFTLRRSPLLKRRPDFAFVSFDRWPAGRAIAAGDAWDVVPDWAVEIVSPSNAESGVIEKLHDYFAAGVRLVWIVYPTVSEVYVYSSPTSVQILTRDDTTDLSLVLPGLKFPLSQLFAAESI
ncbi:MAG: Uma2 family endonuclease [Planctomycetaceae bacterium]|nr:Uma2 family endonuclease [Planctomycetaceae bacterium]